jgi:predicted ATP-grasp superfamily ATP-dependent carboligase
LLEDASTPVIVLANNRQGSIGIVRSLGRLGIPVYGVSADRFDPVLFSKYCRGKFVWDLHGTPFGESVRFLTEVGRKIGRRAVLIPTSDVGAIFVAEHAGSLAEHFTFPDRSAALVRSLCSKREMYQLARKWNVPTPETAFPKSRADVLAYLEIAQFPILMKPIYTRIPNSTTEPLRITLVHTKQELLERYDEAEDLSTANVMFQEYIPGRDNMTWTFNGYFDRKGECRVAFTGRKLRNYPPYFGQASLGICVGNEHVEKETIRFMSAIGYKGPLDLGFRYDARDGRYKVNDINPRIGGMLRLFVGDNGMDMARALYQDMTGQPVTSARTPEGRKWIIEDIDCISALRYWRDGNLGIREWVSSLRGIDEATFISFDDLRPLVGLCLWDAKRLVHRFTSTRRLARQ